MSVTVVAFVAPDTSAALEDTSSLLPIPLVQVATLHCASRGHENSQNKEISLCCKYSDRSVSSKVSE